MFVSWCNETLLTRNYTNTLGEILSICSVQNVLRNTVSLKTHWKLNHVNVTQPHEAPTGQKAWEQEGVWAGFTAQCSLHFPSSGGLSSCQHFNECSGFPPTVSTHPLLHSSPPPRSGCLTTAAAVQECLPYNVTHISKRQSALLLLCEEPVSPRCSLSPLSLFFRTRFTERHSLMSHCRLTFPAAANTNCTETLTYSWAPSLPRFP